MNWIALLPALLLVGCTYTGKEVLASPEVTVVPAPKMNFTLIPDYTTIDVTNNTIRFY